MKCTIPEISWHNRDPVLSVDLQPKLEKNDFYRLASGGTDSHVLIWYLKKDEETGSINLDVAADLTRHQRAVNCVRWSPSGELLASGDDESLIFIWKLKSEAEPINILDTTNETDKEIWITLKILRGHMEDVYDLSWSPNSLNLISGSVDNTAMIWDVQKGKSTSILSDHKGFVQGVAWDPLNQFVATLSTDRYFRIFDINTKKVICRNNKCILSVPNSSVLSGKTVRLFHDDTLQTFFRRLSFSPDGNILVTPSGVAEIEGTPKPLNTTYIYTRASWKQPAIVLQSPEQYTVAVRFCPTLFNLRQHSEINPPIIPLPYRMVFAVATKSCVYLYDTQQKIPFGIISNIHYTRLTDLAWSNDGKILIVSSTDGFCSIITFSKDELGVEYRKVEKVVTEQDSLVPMEIDTNDKFNSKNKPFQIEVRDSKNTNTEIDRETHGKIENQDICLLSKKKETEINATPIEIRRKPRFGTETKIMKNASVEQSEIQLQYSKPINEVILETKNKLLPPIISSQEKFDSPSKEDKPVTPIAIRRHPRSNTEISPKGFVTTPPKADSDYKKMDQTKKATPIEIRRKPREIFQSPVKLKCDIIHDEAIDAWPTELDKMDKSKLGSSFVPMESDRTEDIRLVYEDDEESDKPNDLNEKGFATPTTKNESSVASGGTPKTPRRVDFKTISTPKSKKKIL